MFLWNVWLIFHHIFWKIHTSLALLANEVKPRPLFFFLILLARIRFSLTKNLYILLSLYLNWKRLREYILKLFRQIDQVKSKQNSLNFWPTRSEVRLFHSQLSKTRKLIGYTKLWLWETCVEQSQKNKSKEEIQRQSTNDFLELILKTRRDEILSSTNCSSLLMKPGFEVLVPGTLRWDLSLKIEEL